MAKQWQVSGECAYATVNTAAGLTKMLLYKGAVLPPGVPEREIEHLKTSNLIRPFGDDVESLPGAAVPDLGAATTPQPVGDGKPEGDESGAGDEVQARLDAARAELPEDGSAPAPAAKKDVLAAFLATKGYDFAEVSKSNKPDLVDLVKQNS